ncbi:MAG TPA: ribonuclease T2 [Bryobacteraceae bacterium]|jgi:ribonuclease T2
MTLTICLAVAAAGASAAPKKKKKGGPPAGQFSYYVLSLSWAPDFCAQPNVPKDPAECGAGKQVGFVVHGLWPQGNSGRGPENCGPASPVAQDIVNATLSYIPTAALIQHEWKAHGTCSGLSAADYFAALRKARDSVTIPPDLKALDHQQKLSPAAIESDFASANPAFAKTAFRTSCTAGRLQEVRICLGKDLAPRACTASAGECSAKSVTVLPLR